MCGLLVTENCENLTAIRQNEVFFASIALAVPRATTGPCRPVALTEWRSDKPVVHDVSTPLFNHWRWKLDVFQGKSFGNGDDCDETHYIFGGHGRNGPRELDSAVSEIFLGFQAAKSR